MRQIDFSNIIQEAWYNYDDSRPIQNITDISAQVSTNHVYRVKLDDDDFVIAKLSYFGKFEHFKEDHGIINVMANNLPSPFQNFLARSLMKSNEVYTYRFTSNQIDSWVVFYNPIQIAEKLPRRFKRDQIVILAKELAKFHKACDKVKRVLPPYSKTLHTDIEHLLKILDSDRGQFEYRMHIKDLKRQCDLFFENTQKLNYSNFSKMPQDVFHHYNRGIHIHSSRKSQAGKRYKV